ncbi:DUF6230 family protein [Isoptericola sp. NEAU-Y5]|uniref:DUF6230 family protein n=1 Tax=Isoptericola luteus TaxID=2879484 RepID=A0ABS7ZJ24_9MICO|nr:DUF6230 family protein [Isoptericola sp. NEAU-Y5]MCA5895035.1 DUF6230 family protein [Isoptericola sp. NEAU-Y5]
MKLSALTRTRRGRAMLATIPTVAVIGVLMGGVAQGAVPVSMAISGQQFKISADKLEGTGFSQYAGTQKDADGKKHDVAVANIKDAKLYNLCQSVTVPGAPIGLLISAGTDPKHPVEATDLQIGMSDLRGTATFDKIRIGVDASTVSTEAKGHQGDFAMDSDAVNIDNLKQVSSSTSAAVFKLTDLHLKISDGTACF